MYVCKYQWDRAFYTLGNHDLLMVAHVFVGESDVGLIHQLATGPQTWFQLIWSSSSNWIIFQTNEAGQME